MIMYLGESVFVGRWGWFYILHVRVDPVDKVGGLRVHSGVAGLSAPVSPGDDSGELVAAHEWTARVSLAGVLAALVETSTDHGVSDVALSVGVTAVLVRHNRDVDLLEDASQAASLSGGAPAAHGADRALVVLLHAVGDADGANVGSHADCAIKSKHADVVVDVEAVVVLVEPDLGHGEGLLVRIVLVQVVAAHLDSELGSGHAVTAVSSGDDLVGAHNGAAAHQGTTDSAGEHDLVGELSRVGIGASHNPAATSGQGGRQRLLGEGARGGDCEAGCDDNSGPHCEYSRVLGGGTLQ